MIRNCVNCGAFLPGEIDEGTGVYCSKCGTGQHVATDGGQQRAKTPRNGPDPHPGAGKGPGTTDCPACGDPVEGQLVTHLEKDCPEWGGGEP